MNCAYGQFAYRARITRGFFVALSIHKCMFSPILTIAHPVYIYAVIAVIRLAKLTADSRARKHE